MRARIVFANLLFVALGSHLLCRPTLAADANTDWKSRFLTEAPEEWTKLEQRISGLEGSFNYERHYVDPKKKEDTTKRVQVDYHLKNDSGSALIAMKSELDGKSTFTGFNGQYDFLLVKTNPTLQPYLAQYKPHTSEPKDLMDRIAGQGIGALFAAETYDDGLLLKDLIASSFFKINSAQEVEQEGAKLIRLEVQRTVGETPYPGWILVDPAHHWAVVKYHQEYTAWTTDRQLEYNDAISDIAFPVSNLYNEVHTNGQILSVATHYATPRACELPLSSFQLQSFGLTEPQNTKTRRIRTGLIVTIVLVVVSIFFIIIARRKRRAESPKPVSL